MRELQFWANSVSGSTPDLQSGREGSSPSLSTKFGAMLELVDNTALDSVA